MVNDELNNIYDRLEKIEAIFKKAALADAKWSNNAKFPVLSSLTGSEYFPGLNGGSNFKTLGTTIASFIKNTVTSVPQVVYVSQQGSDVTGNGSVLNPYATASHAEAQITDATVLKPYVIMGAGIINETTLTLKPNVYISGIGGNLTLTVDDLELDASWNGAIGSFIISDMNLSVTNPISWDFTSFGAHTSTFSLQFNSIDTFDLSVIGTGNEEFKFINVLSANTTNLNMQDCTVLKIGGTHNNFIAVNTGSYGDTLIALQSATTYGDRIMQSQGAGTIYCLAENSPVFLGGELTIDGINNQYSCDSNSYSDATFLNGADAINVILTTDGHGVRANYNPINYTVNGLGVSDHLPGIDDALGSIRANQSLQGAYNAGSDAIIDMQSNRPIIAEISTTDSNTNAIVSPSSGTNTVANWRILAFVFSPSADIYVNALQYDDALFTQGGTRPAGIYVFGTEELLVSADIADTDPLVGAYRTKDVTPTLCAAGGTYVYAVVVAANESDYYTNSDAVPAAGISLTQYAVGPSSGSPIPLSYPAIFTVAPNVVMIGSFQFVTFVVDESVELANDPSSNPKEIFAVRSTTRASLPAPVMTEAQRDAITPNMGDRVFVSDIPIPRPSFGSSGWLYGLVRDDIEAGDNIVLTPVGATGLRIDATAETPTDTTSDFGSFSVLNNTTASTLSAANTFKPIIVNAGAFNQRAVSNWVAEIHSISGANTPCMRYVNDGQQYAEISFNLATVGAVPSDESYTFALFLLKASDSSIVDLGYYGYSRTQDLIFPVAVSMCGVAQFETDDRVFVQFKNTSDTNSIYVRDITAKAVSLDTAAVINDGAWSPSYNLGSGITSATTVTGWYSRQQSTVDFILTVDVELTSSPVILGISLPIVANFTNALQAQGGCLSFVDTGTPSILDGSIDSIISDEINQRLTVAIRSAVGSGTKRICLSGSYRIQS